MRVKEHGLWLRYACLLCLASGDGRKLIWHGQQIFDHRRSMTSIMTSRRESIWNTLTGSVKPSDANRQSWSFESLTPSPRRRPERARTAGVNSMLCPCGSPWGLFNFQAIKTLQGFERFWMVLQGFFNLPVTFRRSCRERWTWPGAWHLRPRR